MYQPSISVTNAGNVRGLSKEMSEGLDFDLTEIELADAPKETPESTTPKKEPPKKKKKTKYTKSRYTRLPPSIVINKTVVSTVNKRFLADKKEQMKVSESEIGEASMYMIEYYTSIDPLHPGLVMMGAIMGVGLRVMELQAGKDKPGSSTDKGGEAEDEFEPK